MHSGEGDMCHGMPHLRLASRITEKELGKDKRVHASHSKNVCHASHDFLARETQHTRMARMARTVPLSVKISKETADLLRSYSRTLKVLNLSKSKIVEDAINHHLSVTLANLKRDVEKRLKGLDSP